MNLSSAAQAPVALGALAGPVQIADDFTAYAQSKLALTMWSSDLARSLPDGPVVIAVNPGSLLGTKMLQEGFGRAGSDVGIGVDILCRAALSAEFSEASGRYFDNDSGRFSQPHPDALDPHKCAAIIGVLDDLVRAGLARERPGPLPQDGGCDEQIASLDQGRGYTDVNGK